MNLLKRKSRLSPQAAKVAGASLVAFVAVGAIVLVAYQATPASSVTTSVKPAAVIQPMAEPAGKTAAPAKAKTANGKGVAQAPKSRSWKTLGITKHASSLTLVDRTKRLKLGRHVGERVSVTGALNDREMELKSMKAVSPSCD